MMTRDDAHVCSRKKLTVAKAFGTIVLMGTGSAVVSGCGATPVVQASVSSGQPGTVVKLTGQAGRGCTLGPEWPGVSFERYGARSPAPGATITPPVAANGSWSATFAVPSYLGGRAAGRAGRAVTSGSYQFVSSACGGRQEQRVPFHVTNVSLLGLPKVAYAGIAATPDGQGYWLVQTNGQVQAYGDAKAYGSLPAKEASAGPVVAIARTYNGSGYWLVNAEGHVFAFGDARSYGSLPLAKAVDAPVASMAVAPNGHGYWLLAESGQIFHFGASRLEGLPKTNSAPYDAIVARPAGGYIVTGADNSRAYAYPGGGLINGATNAITATLVGAASTPSGNGAWLAGADGAVYAVGDATFYGSVQTDQVPLGAPVTGIAARPDGGGYWLVGADGSVYGYGDAPVFPRPTP